MAKELALVTPIMLKWARESAWFSITDFAQKIGRPVTEIESREEGKTHPTISQAQKLAKITKRSLAIFYMEEPPKNFQILQDFRRLPSSELNIISSELNELINTATTNQEWIHDYLISEDNPELEFVGKYKITDKLDVILEWIYASLNISINEQTECDTKEEALKLWVSKLEESWVFVFKNTTVSLEECRGFVISDKMAPFIFINSNDSTTGQLFSLIHELVHILINETGLSNSDTSGAYTSDKAKDIEVFCNRIAANVLINPTAFDIKLKSLTKLTTEWQIKKLADFFKVSNEVIARKFLEKWYISNEKYQELRHNYIQWWLIYQAQLKAKRKLTKWGPDYYITKLAHDGHSFVRTVIDAYYNWKVLWREAAYLLNVKVNNIQKLGLKSRLFLS